MDVAVSALRAELKNWIERARDGEEIVVTDRGVPVARLTGVGTTDLLTELERDGVLTPPSAGRPVQEPTAPVAVGVSSAAGAESRGARPSGVAALVRRIRR